MKLTPLEASSASIPLRCSLCPKQPRFSDVSHLLTHIGSKGHLSNEFKLNLRTGKDPSAQGQLDEYRRWYDKHGIAGLLARRMNVKEAKKDQEARADRQFFPHGVPTSRVPQPRPPVKVEHSSDFFCDGISGDYSNWSINSCSNRKNELQLSNRADSRHTPSHRWETNTAGPQMYTWSTAADRTFKMPHLVDQRRSEILTPKSDFSTSLSFNKGLPEDSGCTTPISNQSCAIASDDGSEDDWKTRGEAQLKGVFWPGMTVFDSASPAMRRKRNQRKDASQIKQMERNSTQVVPTEIVYSLDGNYRRERRISALLEELPDLIRRTLQQERASKVAKRPLVEIDKNARRGPKPKTRTSMRSQGRRSDLRGLRHGDTRSKPAFKIYNDPDETDCAMEEDSYQDNTDNRSMLYDSYKLPYFGQGRGMDMLNSGFPDSLHHGVETPGYGSEKCRSGANYMPDLLPRPLSHCSSGKENIDPSLIHTRHNESSHGLSHHPRVLAKATRQGNYDMSHKISSPITGVNQRHRQRLYESPPAYPSYGGVYPYYPLTFDHWRRIYGHGDTPPEKGYANLHGIDQSLFKLSENDDI